MKTTVTILAISLALSACTTKQERTEQISTIDSTLQAKVTSIMENKLKEFGAQSGQAIVMEVQTGQIKASYGKDLNAPCRSKLVCLASLSAALETDKVHLDDTVDAENGVCVVGNDTLFDHNWRRGGYGRITVREAFAKNSVVGNYKVVVKAFGNDMEEYFSKLREAYSMTGDTTSLIVFANHGEWATVAPMQTLALVNRIAANTGNDSLKSALRYTVTDGLGMKANTDKTEIAGISGTTQQEDNSYLAEFCGYFPYDNPQYTVIVSINRNGLPASGGLMAGSVFKEIAEYMTAQ